METAPQPSNYAECCLRWTELLEYVMRKYAVLNMVGYTRRLCYAYVHVNYAYWPSLRTFFVAALGPCIHRLTMT